MRQVLPLMLPALIPSWRFFETIRPSPRVQWRFDGDTVWQEFRPRPTRVSGLDMLRRLFWNPVWNETLYSVSLAERLSIVPTAHSETELFRLIARSLPADIQRRSIAFRLVFVTQDDAAVLFQSASRRMSENPV